MHSSSYSSLKWLKGEWVMTSSHLHSRQKSGYVFPDNVAIVKKITKSKHQDIEHKVRHICRITYYKTIIQEYRNKSFLDKRSKPEDHFKQEDFPDFVPGKFVHGEFYPINMDEHLSLDIFLEKISLERQNNSADKIINKDLKNCSVVIS